MVKVLGGRLVFCKRSQVDTCRRKTIPLLEGGHSAATGNDRSKDVALHGDTERERNNIEEEKVGSVGGGSLAREDTGLDSSTVCDGLIRVDALNMVNNSTPKQARVEQTFSSFFPLKKSLSSFWIRGILVEPPTKTISSTFDLSMAASLRTCWTGSMVPLKALALRSSKRARVIWALKSSPSNRESISTVV